MVETVTVASRFNGPQASGNGGYSAGVVAGYIQGPAEVSLRAPVPLDTPLQITQAEGVVRMLDGETHIAEGRGVSDFSLNLPAPVDMGAARAARSRYRGLPDGEFSRCFVCGRGREDAFGVFAGEVEGRDLVASTWTPPDSAADAEGNVRLEFIWAVLDCPTFFAAHLRAELTMSVLARLTARLDTPLRAGAEHVVIAWPLGINGRKRSAGVALFTADGAPAAIAQALLIEPRSG